MNLVGQMTRLRERVNAAQPVAYVVTRPGGLCGSGSRPGRFLGRCGCAGVFGAPFPPARPGQFAARSGCRVEMTRGKVPSEPLLEGDLAEVEVEVEVEAEAPHGQSFPPGRS